MLNERKIKLLTDLLEGASREEMVWLSGYFAGLIRDEKTTSEGIAQVNASRITIAYGTETGNSKKLASSFAARAKQKGFTAKLVGLDQYRLKDLEKEEYLLTIISTQGEGDPPTAAKKFYDHIHQHEGQLAHLKYGVLALGDTSYPLFCKAGEDMDIQLSKLGAERFVPLQKCDTDYDEDANGWFSQVLDLLKGGSSIAVQAPVSKSKGKHTYTGEVIANINLNDTGSNKETYHIEIAADDVQYEPGDALGVVARNSAATVAAIIALSGVTPETQFEFRGVFHSLQELLQHRLNIVYLPERVVNKYAALVQQEIPVTRIGLLELLKIYPLPPGTGFETLIALLEPIAPRLYSISSSPSAHAGEVHLTVARDRFFVNEEEKVGLCSGYLSEFAPGDQLEFYIHPNRQFRLPAEDKDVIMIGPGTGIAPFRSFLAERDASGHTGRNWLFFGDQHFITDFLYQTELQQWFATGVLTRIDLAFSRDQQEKIYVQQRIREKAAEFFRWLSNGAYVFVCGSRDPMSRDVELALQEIVANEGRLADEAAHAFLEQMKDEGRLVFDVY